MSTSATPAPYLRLHLVHCDPIHLSASTRIFEAIRKVKPWAPQASIPPSSVSWQRQNTHNQLAHSLTQIRRFRALRSQFTAAKEGLWNLQIWFPARLGQARLSKTETRMSSRMDDGVMAEDVWSPGFAEGLPAERTKVAEGRRRSPKVAEGCRKGMSLVGQVFKVW